MDEKTLQASLRSSKIVYGPPKIYQNVKWWNNNVEVISNSLDLGGCGEDVAYP